MQESVQEIIKDSDGNLAPIIKPPLPADEPIPTNADPSTASPKPTSSTKRDNSTLQLLPVTEDDLEEITRVHFSSLMTGSMLEFWPDTPGQRRYWLEAHRHDLKHKPFQHYLKVVDTALVDAEGKGNPRIIALGKWDFSMPDERGQRFPDWHPDANKPRCDMFIGAQENERKRVLEGRRNYYLDLLGTDPEHQRRGAGAMIVKYGCDIADRDGVPIYIDSSAQGKPLYQRFGFQDHSDPRFTWEGLASMVREPRKPVVSA